jgi:hypothetical protein
MILSALNTGHFERHDKKENEGKWRNGELRMEGTKVWRMQEILGSLAL